MENVEGAKVTLFCATCGVGYRFSTRIGRCLNCDKEICVKCSPDHVCPECSSTYSSKSQKFYLILALSGRILMVAGRIIFIIGLLSNILLRIFFKNIDPNFLWLVIIIGFIGLGVSDILVPILNMFWRTLPKLRNLDKSYPK